MLFTSENKNALESETYAVVLPVGKAKKKWKPNINRNYLKLDHCIMQSRDLIGLAAMVYEPLYHVREIATIKLSSDCYCKAKPARSCNIS